MDGLGGEVPLPGPVAILVPVLGLVLAGGGRLDGVVPVPGLLLV